MAVKTSGKVVAVVSDDKFQESALLEGLAGHTHKRSR